MNVKLIKKLGTWDYHKWGLQKRLPYIYNERLTTSHTDRDYWGSITGMYQTLIGQGRVQC